MGEKGIKFESSEFFETITNPNLFMPFNFIVLAY